MAEILPIRRRALSNQSINQSKYYNLKLDKHVHCMKSVSACKNVKKETYNVRYYISIHVNLTLILIFIFK